ncbi:MAG TPA: aminodeoxychorismate/anthranilate synthase component II [Streptosporangiaceae bacterium]|nr:aminodeoxychorismate/anthranilate synthase component II [Streptosporangiaceae bacterium]
MTLVQASRAGHLEGVTPLPALLHIKERLVITVAVPVNPAGHAVAGRTARQLAGVSGAVLIQVLHVGQPGRLAPLALALADHERGVDPGAALRQAGGGAVSDPTAGHGVGNGVPAGVQAADARYLLRLCPVSAALAGQKRLEVIVDVQVVAAEGAVTGRGARDRIYLAIVAHVQVQVVAHRRGLRPVTVVLGSDPHVQGAATGLVFARGRDGCAAEVVCNDEVTASQVTTLRPAGVVISPGPCAPHEAGISIDVVHACALAPVPVPVLGVCLGHQAIAACFGASIARTAPVHGQTSIINHDGRGVLTGLPRRFAAVRYHSLMVADKTVPPYLHITARTRAGIPMGLRHASLPIEGVQFHPESVLTSHGHDIIGNFVSALPDLSRTDGTR